MLISFSFLIFKIKAEFVCYLKCISGTIYTMKFFNVTALQHILNHYMETGILLIVKQDDSLCNH